MFGGRVQFDVIIGNPPYQLSDGGGEGASAVPLYHKFVTQAKSLEPEHLIMVIPARWYSGGKGLDAFRDSMLSDERVAAIHDFAETDLVFPGVNIRGGVCYFLRSKNHSGPVKVTNHRRNQEPISALRPLREPGIETFVRYNEAISILQKVRAKGEPTFSSRVQARNPFGIPSDFLAYSQSKTSAASIRLFRSRRGSSANKEVFVQRKFVEKNHDWIDKIKVLVSKASPGGDEYPHAVFSTPLVASRNSVCTETYLIVDFAKNKTEAENLITYMETQFFRFLVSLVKNTQNISKGCFEFVPILDMTKVWTDEDLYKRYGITSSEARFINTMIRPVVSADE
jgi:site-specific DNA-methyltransferase (adenine-specific)